jgi:predicted TIM-barrel fold metal-dependent hydrolase
MFSMNPAYGDLVAGPNRAWLSLLTEPILEPDLPIIDAHHHLWGPPRAPYLADHLLSDLTCGHRVIGTVFVQCTEAYRDTGPTELRPVGETDFVRGEAENCRNRGFKHVCAGIVGYVDLRTADAVDVALDAHVAAADGRFRGIRQSATWDRGGEVRTTTTSPPEQLLVRPEFQAGFRRLSARNLSFDAWVYHHQLNDVAELARVFPRTKIIINHTGGPVGMASYAGRRKEVFQIWQEGLAASARCPNVYMKLGGLGMPLSGFDFHKAPHPPSSTDLAAAWRPYFEACIDQFGPDRCMFESNFPADHISYSYHVLWNAFKLVSRQYSDAERAQLFSGTAIRVYRLQVQ